MVNTNKLRGLIAERGVSQIDVAKELGITAKTFYQKMKKGVFDSDEMSRMILFLGINDPIPIFFADTGTNDVPNK